jgi:GT2 family glycosyltransferase
MVACLTVTYGNRIRLLSKVIDRVLQENVDKIIVVNNNASPESAKCLTDLMRQHQGKIEVIDLPRNTGTAYAFKIGLEQACRSDECEYIWLLDDDNVPEEGTLQKLLNFISTPQGRRPEVCCLTSDRVGSHYINCIRDNNPMIALGRMNSFWGFHLMEMPKKILKRLSSYSVYDRPLPKPYGEIRMVPYGGLFINRDIIPKVGYPDISYFMYVDDYEYTFRISKAGYKIYLLGTTRIHDIEKGWEAGLKGPHFSRLAKSRNPIRLYYSARNMIRFQRENTVSNASMYYLNFLTFITFFLLACLLRLKFRNIATMWLAICAAFGNEHGESANFKLNT